MSITYSQKLFILDHLLKSRSWKNLFDIDFFKNESRKWKSMTVDSIEISASSDGSAVCVKHKSTDSMLLFKQESGFTVIEDESKRIFSLEGHCDDGISISDVEVCGDKIDLASVKAQITFSSNGQKSVRFVNTSQVITFMPPSENLEKKLPLGRLFHAACFDDYLGNEWGIGHPDLLNSVKIILAREMGMQPTLKAQNSFKEEALMALYQQRILSGSTDTIKKCDFTQLENPWNDVTEFNGYDVATPFQFFVQKTKEGFQALCSFGHKHRVLSHANLVKTAVNEDVIVMDAPPNISTDSLYSALRNADIVEDHLGTKWMTCVFDKAVSYDVWKSIHSLDLSLTGDDLAAINFATDRCVVAVRQDVLQAKI